jgi:hypothetical protein
MQVWKNSSPYTFTGYYLKAPCHGNASWSGTRAKLVAMGWGIAVIYVGRQVKGPCSNTPITSDLGPRDGMDAVAKTTAEGFPPNTVVYLDVEAMDTITPAIQDYTRAWFTEVLNGGFVPGMYCHVRNAPDLRAAVMAAYPSGAPAPLFWVAGGKKPFDPANSTPSDSGVGFAEMWQGRLDTDDTQGSIKLRIDMDVAAHPDPSGVYVQAPAAVSFGAAAAAPSAPVTSDDPLATVNDVIQRNLHLFDQPGIVNVRAGYQVSAGQPTGRLAIVVKVLNKDPNLPQDQQLPRQVEGIPVDVRQAGLLEQLQLVNPDAASLLQGAEEFATPSWDYSYGALASAGIEFAAAAAKPRVDYEPASVPLDVVEDQMTINCHISPDAGWANLKPFLEGTRKRLTVGMYDFGADHIKTAFQTAVRGKQLTMVLDSNPNGPDEHPLRQSLEQELGAKLKFAWAAEGSSPDVTAAIFPNAYHIKVAVRDTQSMWLSSGNWMDSNQPDIDPIHQDSDRKEAAKRNREWHVIIEHKGLASLYEKYLQNDFAQASGVQAGVGFGVTAAAPQADLFVEEPQEAFAVDLAKPPREFFSPLVLHDAKIRIQPILSPDNYASKILQLIQSATKSFYMQTQYIHVQETSPSGFLALIRALQERMHHGVDVRLIVHERESQGDWIEKLRGMKFDTSVIRVQPGIHNKGMVVDSKIAVVGSQNWSADGVLRNRDASLILFNEQIARYFERIFLHDWTRLARPYTHKPAKILAAAPGQAAPPGFRRMSMAEFMAG